MKKAVFLLFLFTLACESKKEYLIQIPENARITSEYILSELEERAKEEPENEWLLNQQLYFCEQLGWPNRCERPLRRARERFGLTERLIDRFVTFYLQQGSYDELAQILQGAMETRPRLEALIQIAIRRDSVDLTYLNRYLERNQDARARQIAINSYLFINDSVNAINQIKALIDIEPHHPTLKDVYPVLLDQKEYASVIQVLDYQRTLDSTNTHLALDQATAYYHSNRPDTAKLLLKRFQNTEAFLRLHEWYKQESNYDSALAYLKKSGDYSQNPTLQLSHAELLENKGFITLSLPFYETALALDSTNLELQNRVDIVRRKVAYLRKKREEQALPATPKVERKTIGN